MEIIRFLWRRLMAWREELHAEADRMHLDPHRYDHFRPPGEDCP
jgi:hypothetical protein